MGSFFQLYFLRPVQKTAYRLLCPEDEIFYVEVEVVLAEVLTAPQAAEGSHW